MSLSNCFMGVRSCILRVYVFRQYQTFFFRLFCGCQRWMHGRVRADSVPHQEAVSTHEFFHSRSSIAHRSDRRKSACKHDMEHWPRVKPLKKSIFDTLDMSCGDGSAEPIKGMCWGCGKGESYGIFSCFCFVLFCYFQCIALLLLLLLPERNIFTLINCHQRFDKKFVMRRNHAMLSRESFLVESHYSYCVKDKIFTCI